MSASRTIAKIVSIVFMPLFMPTYGISLLMTLPPYSLPGMAFYRLLCIVCTLFFTFLIPGALLLWLKKTGYISDIEMADRTQRTLPYLLSTISYAAWTAFLMEKMHVPDYLAAIVIGGCAAMALILVVNLFWKISAHLAGWGGFMGGYFGICFQYGLNPVGIFVLLCVLAGLLMWARLRLHAHTPMQTVAGLCVGFLSAFVPCIFF